MVCQLENRTLSTNKQPRSEKASLPLTGIPVLEIGANVAVPCALLQTLDEVIDRSQVEALGLIEKSDSDGIRLVSVPLRFNDQRLGPVAGTPKLSDYNAEFTEPSKEGFE